MDFLKSFWRHCLLTDKPRWLVLLVDVLLMTSSFLVSYILIFSKRGGIELDNLFGQLLIVGAVYYTSFLIFHTHLNMIRRTGLRDLQQIVTANIVAFIGCLLLVFLLERSADILPIVQRILPFSDTQLLFHAFITGFSMTCTRLAYRAMYHELIWNQKDNRIPVILFGAGNMGNTTFHFIQTTTRNKYRIVAVLDDNPNRIGKRIQGFQVYDLNRLNKDFVQEHGNAHELIIAVDDLNPERLNKVFKLSEPIPLITKIIPDTARMLAGEVATRQIRSLRVEDLLGRETINLNNSVVHQEMTGKVVLVTGGAGSIGSELVRQIGLIAIAKLVVLDQAESPLYELQQELKGYAHFNKFEFIVGDVRDEGFMRSVFESYLPNMLYHAAAYKHVPLMEANPYEAVLTNVWGSYNVAQLAESFAVEKFVMVSTDKAVNPTNVMGATKRVAEIAVTSINQRSKTNFIVTRFGNVLGSNGSVIPLFEKQMLKGGPLTITHPDITRYFMTIPEACQLVQEAMVMGTGGEVFVFDMGKPVKIMDLARQMIRLKGYSYPEDIDIKVVGLRPGEKIFEELLANDENTIKTHHNKIMIAKVNTDDIDAQRRKIEQLCSLVRAYRTVDNQMAIVALIKEIVPEYKSQNSIFEVLDK